MANRKGRELRKQVERAMREEGARNFSLSVTGTCHQRLDFTTDGFEGHFYLCLDARRVARDAQRVRRGKARGP